MKKIIGFFKVLFHLKSTIDDLNNIIDQLNRQGIIDGGTNFRKFTNMNMKFLYLEKFVLSLKNKPLYEIGQTVFFYLDKSAEKPNEENKLQGKIISIWARHKFEIMKFGVVMPEYEYIYNLELKDGAIEVPESKIIM